MKTLPLILVLFLLSGCFGMPRLFQKKVPAPLEKPPAQVENERRAADLIARAIESPVELIPVAQGLSSSLGKPVKPLHFETIKDLPKAASISTAELQLSLSAMQKQLDQLNRNLTKYQGMEIEGTGFSLAGPGMVTIAIILIVLAVACPPALTLMAFAYQRMKAAASIVVTEIENASQAPETKAAVAEIKQKIQTAMVKHPTQTTALKQVVTNLKTA